jgi:hypothetical protein
VTGFHGRAELCAHGVTVYLLPGMTRWQRKAVLRRLRMEASRGYGPALPLPQLALALAVDRVRTALKITAGVIRLHPSQTLLPSAAAVVLMTFFVLAAAGSRLQLSPPASLDGMVSGGGNAAVAAGSAVDHLRAKPARFGPVTDRGIAAAVAGLPAGQWGVKPAALAHAALRVEQACFGAMPGVGSAQSVQLACTPTASSPSGG